MAILTFTFIIATLIQLQISSGDHSGANSILHPKNVKRLVIVQNRLKTAFKKVILDNRLFKTPSIKVSSECVNGLKEYLQEVEADLSALDKMGNAPTAFLVKGIVENPLFTMKLVRRFVVTLMEDALPFCPNGINETINSAFAKEDVRVPSKKELGTALFAVLKIQYVYGFKASTMQKGILGDFKTGAVLRIDECLALARKAFNIRAHVLAYQWLYVASTLLTNTNDDETDFKKEIDGLWKRLLKVGSVGNVKELHKILGKRNQQSLKNLADFKEYDLCRGEVLNDNYAMNCFYGGADLGAYFALTPLKIEVHSEMPLIFQCYDMLTEKEIQFVKSITVDFSAKDLNLEKQKMWTELKRKIEKVIKMEVVNEGASQVDLAHYGVLGGDDYKQHTPLLENQFATFSLFLSDVHVGGYTVYPNANIYVKPLKGSAIFWHSTFPDLMEDIRTVNEECPIVLGEKIVANWNIFEVEDEQESINWSESFMPYGEIDNMDWD